MRTGTNACNWAGVRAVSWATRTWTGAGEWAWARAEAVARNRQRAIPEAVIELWAGDRTLTRTVFLIVVPGSGRRRGSVVLWRG